MKMHEFPYKWCLKDSNFKRDKGKVFSCFSGLGGSTMGYKLAGFDVIGHNDVDPKMIEDYKLNHNPKFSFLESITTFSKRKDLPKQLYNLDILDGSPPCSSFSMAGNREKDWGKKKKFREGQEKQVLDTLFFDFIDLAKKLQPKVIIAENVKGILMGNAVKYTIEIYKNIEKAGYNCQHFLLDASKMGVPQKRERVLFIALRNDLCEQFIVQKDIFTKVPLLNMSFCEPKINGVDFFDYQGKQLTYHAYSAWKHRNLKHTKLSDSKKMAGMKESNFNCKYIFKNKPISTLTANGYHSYVHYDHPLYISKNEYIYGSSFPIDYLFKNTSPFYGCGMSVPPVMMANIAKRIYDQWISKF